MALVSAGAAGSMLPSSAKVAYVRTRFKGFIAAEGSRRRPSGVKENHLGRLLGVIYERRSKQSDACV